MNHPLTGIDAARSQRDASYTKAAFDGLDARHYGAIHMPIYQNSLFAFDNYREFELAMGKLMDHHVYSRGNNPTVEYLEHKLAELEGAEAAKCFSSGMAAITASILSVVAQGDHIVCVDQAYGPTQQFLRDYLPRFGIETTFADGKSVERLRAAVRPNTKLIYLESPTTLLFELQDLRACAQLAKSVGAATIIDNSWATPIFQNPLACGIDLVVHSITKYIGGHSDCIGGVVLGAKQHVERMAYAEYMLFGGIMTAQTAASVSRGLRTLPLRMQRHEESGLAVAEHVAKLDFVTRVNHPGLPVHPQHALGASQMQGYASLFSVESMAPTDQLKAWIDELKFFKIGVSWGGFESLATVRRLEEKAGKPAYIRLYVGLENPSDLIADLEQAWDAVNA